MLVLLDTLPGDVLTLAIECPNPLCRDRPRLHAMGDGGGRLACPGCGRRYDLLVRIHPGKDGLQISLVFLADVRAPEHLPAATTAAVPWEA